MTDLTDRVPLPKVRDLLRVGHPLPFRVLDADGRLLLNEGQMLSDEAQFEALVERGAWAERALVEAARTAQAAAAGTKAAASAVSLFDRWERLIWQFDKLTRALVRRQVPGTTVVEFFGTLQNLIDADPDVALFTCVRRDDRRFALYALTHSLHCAVIALMTARQLAWPAEKIASLCCAALTMNLEIFELQATMAEQDDPPSSKQIAQIRAHPEGTAALLRAVGVTDAAWLTAVAQHHEQPGGAGYPQKLSDVDELAQVLRAADVFMAKISPRAKRPPLAPQTAMRQLYQQNPNDRLAMAMIRTVGLYPPGSLVTLVTGETAVAIRRHPKGTHPMVATLSDQQGKPIGATHRRDSSLPEFAIRGALEETKSLPRVLPERVYGWIAG
ncbi:MAG: HD domain-containing phosphohydrolase [Burkholderiales bacterium]